MHHTSGADRQYTFVRYTEERVSNQASPTSQCVPNAASLDDENSVVAFQRSVSGGRTIGGGGTINMVGLWSICRQSDAGDIELKRCR